jgi:POTRA domain, FtsQ-type
VSRDLRRRPARDLNPRTSRRRSTADRIRLPSLRVPRPSRRLTLGAYTRTAARALVLVVELLVVVGLVKSPALAARRVYLSGNKHVTRQQVIDRVGLRGAPSMLLLSTDEAQTHLRSDPYVRTVSVRTTLPDRVEIDLLEWEPLAVLSRAGAFYLLNSEGGVLGLAPNGRAGAGLARVALSWDSPGPVRSGQAVLKGRLVQDLDRIQAAFPGAYGLTITSFALDSNQKLAAVTSSGPRILFGQMATDEQIDSLDSKLASLKSLRARLDLANSKLDYINLENPGAITTGAIPSPSPTPPPGTPTRRP